MRLACQRAVGNEEPACSFQSLSELLDQGPETMYSPASRSKDMDDSKMPQKAFPRLELISVECVQPVRRIWMRNEAR